MKSIFALDTVSMMYFLKFADTAIKLYVVAMIATPISLHTGSKLSPLSRILDYILHTLVSVAM